MRPTSEALYRSCGSADLALVGYTRRLSMNGLYIHDFAHDYWLHKVNIHLYRGVSRAELERVITEGEVWSKTAVRK